MHLRQLLFAVTVMLTVCAHAVRGEVTFWSPPDQRFAFDHYKVTINNRRAPVWRAHALPQHGGDYGFVRFDFSGQVTVIIDGPQGIADAKVLPERPGVMIRRLDDALEIRITDPTHLVIERDGRNAPLMLFADRPQANPPSPGDANVIYFAPGVHKVTRQELASNQTLYLAGGAVLQGSIFARGAQHIRIAGRGVVDGSPWAWRKGPGQMIDLLDCKNVEIEDVILRASWGWTCVPKRCEGVTIRNLKILNGRCQNDDGINPCNSQRMLIDGCFIRTDDDCVALKGLHHLAREDDNGRRFTLPVEDVTVRRSTLWCDRARIVLLGHESQAPAMQRIRFRDIDVLHWRLPVFLMEPGERMLLTDIVCEDIRVRGGQDQRHPIVVRPVINMYMKIQEYGDIRNIVFRNIDFVGPKAMEFSAFVEGCKEHVVSDVAFENVRFNERQMRSPGPHLKGLSFTERIRVHP